MPAGHRDQIALDAALSLTEAAARMRSDREKTLETRVELDGSALDALRRDLAEALVLMASEMDQIKRVVIAIGEAAEAESKRRA